ncbi:MAG: amidohydrolase family protein [Chloroflexi bacterium]|nr:amidohydrolase family protein [Chloroflexota bacterium]
MKLDLSQAPVVDVHCHPYTRKDTLTADEFTNVTAFGGGSAQYLTDAGLSADDAALARLQRVKRDTIYFRNMVHTLAEQFGCAADIDAIVAARNNAIAAEGYAAYNTRMLKSAGVSTLVADFGYPVPNVPVAQFRAETGVEIVPIYRIEVLIAELLKQNIGWDECRRRFDDAANDALLHQGYRGLKSIIAYRTGLDVSPLSRNPDQGMQAWEAIQRGTGGGGMKKLRDYFFCRALELCMEHNVPMQVHTGMGDWQVQLTACRPALLMDLLRFPTFRGCRVLLVHTGYPYHAEAGYMANVLPNLWLDLSEGIPFAGQAARRIVAEVLEMAPLSRVCYGSDAFGSPEPFHTSARLGKRAVTQALESLVADGMLSSSEAQAAALQILSQNARDLYGL